MATFDKLLNKTLLHNHNGRDITGGDIGSKVPINSIQFDTTPTAVTPAEGLLQWNPTDGTLNMGMSGGDITQQIGQELFMKVRNVSGSTIPNGTPVYVSGRTGNRPNIYLAKSDIDSTSNVIGLTTQDIDSPADGFVTTLGYVRQIKTDYSGAGNWGTTWTDGDKLYISKTVAGQLTNVEPTAPHHSDIIGTVAVVGGAGIGSILVNLQIHKTLEELTDVDGGVFDTNGQTLVWNNDMGYFTRSNAFPSTGHYTGFPDRTSTSISFDDSTYTLTLTATDDPIWINGVSYQINTLTKQLSVAQEAVTGLYWFWITAPLGVPQLNVATSAPGFDKCLVGTVYWNTTTNKGIISDERHWMGRDKWMHEYLHETIGARYAQGMAGTFTNTTISIGAGEFYDEDIEHDWSDPITTVRVMYKNGSDAWAWDILTTPYKVVNPGIDNNLRYNTGTTLSTATANRYVNQWVFATADVNYPIQVFIGTAQYTTLAAARAAQPPSLGGLGTAENKLIYHIIYQNTSGTPTYQESIDYRTASSLPTGSYVATDHGTLAGLTDLDHPATAIMNTPAGNIVATTVQAAIDELDSEKLDSTLAGTTYLKLIGGALVPTANSTTTFQIFKQDGTTNVLNVDTTNGRVGIGTVAPTTNLNILGADTAAGYGGQLNITSSDTLAINKGGAISFGGAFSGTTPQIFAEIAGRKENSTNPNGRGYLAFFTSTAVPASERMRIDSNGKVGLMTSVPTSDLSFGGNSARTIALERHTTADTVGNNFTVQAGGATVGATNKAGGNLILSSGISTGTATSQIQLFLPTASTGTTDNVPSVKGYIVPSTNGCSLILSSSTTGNTSGINLNGNTGQSLFLLRHTTANTAGNNLTVQAGGATSGATDKAGGTLTLKSGISTGTGLSQILLQTCTPAASTGTADNAFATRVTIDNTGMVSTVNVTAPNLREKLTAARTYYVRTDGNDSNTGLVNTAGGAFLTIQKAINTTATLDLSIYDVTINIADGTYSSASGNVLKQCIGSGVVFIIGNETTPANVVVQVTTGYCFGNSIDGLSSLCSTIYHLRGMKLTTASSGGIIAFCGFIYFQNIDFGVGGNQIRPTNNGQVQATGAYTISAGAAYHVNASKHGRYLSTFGMTLTGTPAFSVTFVTSSELAWVSITGTITGSATGTRYNVFANGVINTVGGGATYLPGNAGGTTSTGGIYI